MPFAVRGPLFVALVASTLVPSVRAEEAAAVLSFAEIAATATTAFEPTDAERLVPERFRLRAHAFDSTAIELRTVGAVRSYAVTFPSPIRSGVERNDTVHATYFQPAGEGPHAGCVLLHILGGDFTLMHTVADLLARRGVATLVIKMPFYGERRDSDSRRRMISFNPDHTVANVSQAVHDVRRSIAWLADRPEVDDDRLGVAGISLGGFVASTAGAVEPRCSRVAVVLAGGDVANMIWNHADPEAQAFRRQWEAIGGTCDSLARRLADVEPVTHAARLRDRPVLMIAATRDEIVPRASTVALFEAAGRKPELVWLEAGHITAAFYLYREVGRLAKFLAASPSE
jgi:dienelactone hydrolase